MGVRSTTKDGAPGYLPPSEVRALADWTIKRRLQSVNGIAEVLNTGGGVKQIEVRPDPYRLPAHGVSFAELEAAVAGAANTTTPLHPIAGQRSQPSNHRRGKESPTVVQIKATPTAKTVTAKFNFDLAKCGECRLSEYACLCDH